jgi:hypothetical protein
MSELLMQETEMRIKAIKKMTLLSALCGAGIVIATGCAVAENGSGTTSAGQSRATGNGAISVSLRKLNGIILSNDIALAKANDNSVHGYARAYRDAANGLGTLEEELEILEGELSALQNTRTDEDIQADIDALKVENFHMQELYDAEVKAYQDEMLTAPSDSDLAGLISAKEGKITAMTAEIATLESDRDEAWENLTGGRELTEEALVVLKAKLGIE